MSFGLEDLVWLLVSSLYGNTHGHIPVSLLAFGL